MGAGKVAPKGGVTPERRHHLHRLLGARPNPLVLIRFQDDVDAERGSVSARVAWMRSRTDPGGVQVSASMPRPPAFETAAASPAVDALPTGR